MKSDTARWRGDRIGLVAVALLWGCALPARAAGEWDQPFAGLPQLVELLRQNYIDFEQLDPAEVEAAAVTGILRSLGTGARGYADPAGAPPSPALDGIGETRFHAHVLAPDVGYIHLGALDATTAVDLAKTLAQWVPAGAPDDPGAAAPAKVGALVIDLRFVASADLAAAAEVLEFFAPEGATTFRVEGPEPTSYQARRAPSAFAAMPVVAVVNGYTGAAAEAVAGALRELVRAVVIGEPTEGAGLGYARVALPGERQVELANAKLVFPSGASCFPHGLEPDIKAAMEHGLELRLLLYRIGVREEPADDLARALEEVRLNGEGLDSDDLETAGPDAAEESGRELTPEDKERRRLLAEERKLLETEHRFGLDRDTVLQRAVDLVRGLKALKFRT